MNPIKVKLVKKSFVADETLALWVEKPRGFKFEAGQYIDLGFEDNNLPDYERFRELSIGNTQNEDTLLLAFRMSESTYKKRLLELVVGSELLVMGPYGRFTLHQEAKIPAVFIAGGIGVVPFRSMVLEATKRRLSHKLFLFYSNHSLTDVAFLEDLKKAADENSNFIFVPTLTAKGHQGDHWQGELGHITTEMINKYLSPSYLADSTYYICGTPDMVLDFRMMLYEAGVSGSNVRTESFTGY
jgi:ferredoxin-NADP reductase